MEAIHATLTQLYGTMRTPLNRPGVVFACLLESFRLTWLYTGILGADGLCAEVEKHPQWLEIDSCQLDAANHGFTHPGFSHAAICQIAKSKWTDFECIWLRHGMMSCI